MRSNLLKAGHPPKRVPTPAGIGPQPPAGSHGPTLPADEWYRQTIHDLLLEDDRAHTQAAQAAAALRRLQQDHAILADLLQQDAADYAASTARMLACVALSRQELAALDRFATWIAGTRILFGLLRRRQPAAAARIGAAMRSHGVPERCHLAAAFAQRRFLIGLMWQRLSATAEAAQAIVFLRLVRAAVRAGAADAAGHPTRYENYTVSAGPTGSRL